METCIKYHIYLSIYRCRCIRSQTSLTFEFVAEHSYVVKRKRSLVVIDVLFSIYMLVLSNSGLSIHFHLQADVLNFGENRKTVWSL